MKELTQEQFEDRMGALVRAERIFPDVLNITERFKLYQEVFAEREREIFITSQGQGKRNGTFLDRYERPKCPDCGADMKFRPLAPNDEGLKTQWVCSGCDLVLSFQKSIDEWMQELKVKNEST